VDPSTGSTVHVASDAYFTQLIGSPDGATLFGVQDWPTDRPTVKLMRIDSRTGRVLAAKELTSNRGQLANEWSLAFAKVPADLIPKGENAVEACRLR
jgi:hypothetical protein